MALQIGVDRRGLEHGVVVEAAEERQQALRRLLRGFEIAHGGPIGRLLFAALVGEHAALGDLLAADRDTHAARTRFTHPGAGAADGGSAAQDHRGGRHNLGVLQLLAQAHQMPAGDVAALVREDADDLVGSFGVDERAGVHEDVLAVGHESIERARADQHDLDRASAQAGCLGDRLQIVAHELFDLGIADKRRALVLGGGRQRQGGDAQAQCRHEGGTAEALRRGRQARGHCHCSTVLGALNRISQITGFFNSSQAVVPEPAGL